MWERTFLHPQIDPVLPLPEGAALLEQEGHEQHRRVDYLHFFKVASFPHLFFKNIFTRLEMTPIPTSTGSSASMAYRKSPLLTRSL